MTNNIRTRRTFRGRHERENFGDLIYYHNTT